MIEIPCEQNSPEWLAARCGLITSSNFSDILAEGRGKNEVGHKNPSVSRAKLLRKLAAERITGEVQEGYKNANMDRGHEWESEARAAYQITASVSLKRVGLVVLDDRSAGASPDGLHVGAPGGAEFKTAQHDIQVDYIENAIKDPFWYPPAHRAQCQGVIWICELEFIDLTIYCRRLPLFIKRIYRDEPYIKTLAAEVGRANAEIARIVERVGAYVPEAA